jgi:hypothetical protein
MYVITQTFQNELEKIFDSSFGTNERLLMIESSFFQNEFKKISDFRSK